MRMGSSEEETSTLTGLRSEPCNLSEHPEPTWDLLAYASRGVQAYSGPQMVLGDTEDRGNGSESLKSSIGKYSSFTHKGTMMRLTVNFPSETVETRRHWVTQANPEECHPNFVKKNYPSGIK